MKLIKAGRPDERFWWVGKHMHCPRCAQVVQLERGDASSAAWIDTQDPRIVRVSCSNCGDTMQLVYTDPDTDRYPRRDFTQAQR